jgi:hypothetical protein
MVLLLPPPANFGTNLAIFFLSLVFQDSSIEFNTENSCKDRHSKLTSTTATKRSKAEHSIAKHSIAFYLAAIYISTLFFY